MVQDLPKAPLVPEVHAIPRALPTKGSKTNLVGLTRSGMAAALLEAGTSEKQVKMRVGQIWQ